MQHQIEPHRLSDRIRGKLLFMLAWPALMVAVRRTSRPTELWIGDSHAVTYNREVTNGMFMRAPCGQLILRAGPRLMFSLAQHGLPPRVHRVAKFVNRFGKPGALIPVFMAGEIDVRVHLADRPEETFEFVGRYVERCLDVTRVLKAERVAFAVPPPPVDVSAADRWFPIVGSIEQRLDAHGRLRGALARAVERAPGAMLLDFTAALSGGPTGGMPVELTSDGAHTNLDAVALIRAEIMSSHLLTEGAGASARG
jgi:hypothetical protein